MIRLMSTAGQAMALPEAANWNEAGTASAQERRKIQDTLSIPSRGLLWGTLMSSCLWALLIAVGRALWLYLR